MKTVKLDERATWIICRRPVTCMGAPSATVALENRMLEQAYKSGYGAQFGGKYFAWTFVLFGCRVTALLARWAWRFLLGGSQCQSKDQ